MTGSHIWAGTGVMRGLGDKVKGNRPSFYTKTGKLKTNHPFAYMDTHGTDEESETHNKGNFLA